jgi:hypothetical protein
MSAILETKWNTNSTEWKDFENVDKSGIVPSVDDESLSADLRTQMFLWREAHMICAWSSEPIPTRRHHTMTQLKRFENWIPLLSGSDTPDQECFAHRFA